MTNALTGAVFTVRKDGVLDRASLVDIMTGKREGWTLSGSGALREAGQIWLAATLVRMMLEGREFDEDTFMKGVEKWQGEYNLLGDGRRFMQHPTPEPDPKDKTNVLSTPLEVHNFMVLSAPGGDTNNPFAYSPSTAKCYCSACATVDLFLFQMMCSGAGGQRGGPYNTGTLTFNQPHGDAQTTILANIVVRDWRDRNNKMIEGRADSLGYTPSWARKSFTDILEAGTDVDPSDEVLTHSVLATWMTRQVWLSGAAAPEGSRCFACGLPASDTITRLVKTGAGKGMIRLSGKVPSIFHPSRLEKEDVTFFKGTSRPSQLLPFLPFFVSDQYAGKGDRPASILGKNRGDMSVLSTVFGKGGSFGGAAYIHLPISRIPDVFSVSDVLRDMNTLAEIHRGRLRRALEGATREKSGGKPAKNIVDRGLSEYNSAVDQFSAYMSLQEDSGDLIAQMSKSWGRFLRDQTVRIYESLIVPYANTSEPKWKRLVENHPNHTRSNTMSASKNTTASTYYNRYVSASAQNTAIKPMFRRFEITSDQIIPDDDLFRVGLAPTYYAKDGSERFSDTLAALAVGLPFGLKHDPDKSFGQGLFEACKVNGKVNENRQTRAFRLCTSEGIYEFADRLRTFLRETGGVACNLDALHGELIGLMLGSAPKTKWLLPLYPSKFKKDPVAEDNSEDELSEAAE